MFINGFSLAVRADDQYLKEFKVNGEPVVYVPFDTKYEICVKNKTDKKALATVSIDGTDITSNKSRFLIKPYSTSKYARFITDSLEHGPSFVFTKATDENASFVSSDEMGLVVVKIYPQKKAAWEWTYITPTPWRQERKWPEAPKIKSFCYDGNLGEKLERSCNADYFADGNVTAKNAPRGVTVGGDTSSQSFSNVSGFETEEFPIILKVRLMGATKETTSVNYCPSCGKRANKTDRFCSMCGNKLFHN